MSTNKSIGWVTIYFKDGKITETVINNFVELDEREDKEDIVNVKIGCCIEVNE